jgi:DNA-binding response OmpR family regulator
MAYKILIVDDEPDILEMLNIRLSKNGYDVVTAVTGEECLEKTYAERPDLILLDVLLPGMSGLEVSKRLKNDDSTKNIPIIMVTALIGKDAAQTGLDRGAKYFISKPFDPEELLAQIKRILEEKI